MSILIRYLCFRRYSYLGATSRVFKGKGRPKPLKELPQVYYVGFDTVGFAPFRQVLDYALPGGGNGQQW